MGTISLCFTKKEPETWKSHVLFRITEGQSLCSANRRRRRGDEAKPPPPRPLPPPQQRPPRRHLQKQDGQHSPSTKAGSAHVAGGQVIWWQTVLNFYKEKGASVILV